MTKAEIGLIGLGVMGRMLALNMARNGVRVAGHDVDGEKARRIGMESAPGMLIPCESLEAFLAVLESPRRILMMVPAGQAVDRAIAAITPGLRRGDLLMDGGNSHFLDTERRSIELSSSGIAYFGVGISGGEQGALHGPSIMAGGPAQAWACIGPLFEAISAKIEGEPCAACLGPRGAGHYVKMVHNGIEYGEMQLIAEAYDILVRGLGLSGAQLHRVFAQWNRGELESYLVEITADIFTKTDPTSGAPLVDLILDEAQHKGTGKWTSQNSFDLGAPIPTINAALESRLLSACKAERLAASQVLVGPRPRLEGEPREVIVAVGEALYAARLCSYAQGFGLLGLAGRAYGYHLDCGEIARIWRGGCILRARFLNDVRAAFTRNPGLANLMLDPEVAGTMNARQESLRKVVSLAAERGIPVPAFGASLAYYDAYRSARLPANLIQAQRDYFGAHTYRRIDCDEACHTEWQGGCPDPGLDQS